MRGPGASCPCGGGGVLFPWHESLICLTEEAGEARGNWYKVGGGITCTDLVHAPTDSLSAHHGAKKKPSRAGCMLTGF